MSDRIQSREFFEQVIVAKIWKDEDFKKEILADPNKTIRALLQERDPEAVDKLPDIDIRVVAETPTQIYVTLPEDVEEPVTAIGDEDKKTMNRKQVENILASRALSDASALAKLKDDTKGALESALQELDPNLTLPDNLKVTLLEESENVVYLVVPPDPTALADSELTEEQLEAVHLREGDALAGGDSHFALGDDLKIDAGLQHGGHTRLGRGGFDARLHLRRHPLPGGTVAGDGHIITRSTSVIIVMRVDVDCDLISNVENSARSLLLGLRVTFPLLEALRGERIVEVSVGCIAGLLHFFAVCKYQSLELASLPVAHQRDVRI